LDGKIFPMNCSTVEKDNYGIHNVIYAEIMNKCPLEIKDDLRDVLMSFIQTYCNEDITKHINSVKNAHKYYSPSVEEKYKLHQIEVALKASIVHYLYLTDNDASLFTSSNLLEMYPGFECVESQAELEALRLFRNNMKVALYIIPAKQNKRLLLDICTLLEGQGKSYVTGGAQVPATARRVSIYEHESNVKPQTRAPRKSVSKGSGNQSPNCDKVVKSSQCVACKCGAAIRVSNMWRHLRTAKHILAVKIRDSSH